MGWARRTFATNEFKCQGCSNAYLSFGLATSKIDCAFFLVQGSNIYFDFRMFESYLVVIGKSSMMRVKHHKWIIGWPKFCPM